MTKKQKLPEWFEGDIYDKGGIATNQFSGQSIKLNRYELSMYDFLLGAQIVLSYGGTLKDKTIKEVQKGTDWFLKNNPENGLVAVPPSS